MKIRCMKCMKMFSDEYEICPYCGYIIGTPAEKANYMEPGTTLGSRYTVGKAIGAGSFGVTYIGWDQLLSQPVAIKEYLPGEFSTRMPGKPKVTVYSGEREVQFHEGRRKFTEEAKRLAKAGSIEGVVKIIDNLELNGTAYIIMEYLKGETLEEYLQKTGILPYSEAIEIIISVLSALEKVHKEGILHRDIAPDNIFLCDDGRIKILDFGAARYATVNYSKSLSVLLKPGYAPEEQYRSRGKQGPWSDVYSTAATLYRMTTGIVPEDALERTINDGLKEPHKINKDIPVNISNAIMNGLNIYQQNRTPSAADFKNELVSSEAVARRKEERRGTSKSIPLWMKVAVAAVIILTLLAAGFFLDSSARDILKDGQVYIPDIINLTDEEASEAAKKNGLDLQIEEGQYNDKIERGKIVSQNPVAGHITEINHTFNAVMSKGPRPVEMPFLIGEKQNEAENTLEGIGLISEVKEKYGSAAPGTVYAQSEEGGETTYKGSIIRISVSKGIDGINKKKKTRVPELDGMSYKEALENAEKSKIYIKVVDIKYSSSKKNDVLKQHIKAGKKVKEGTIVEIVLSKGIREYVVPDVQYSTKKKAVAAFKKEGISCKIKYQYSKTYKKGVVLKQSIEAGRKVKDDTIVTIWVSKGKKVTKVSVPSVVGLSKSAAISALQNAGLNYSIAQEDNSSYAKGTVFSQSYGGGSKIAKGTEVIIYISTGPGTTIVPDVVTLPKGDAIAVLREEGLNYSVIYRRDPDYSGVVISQSISSGRSAKKGTVVTIVVGR